MPSSIDLAVDIAGLKLKNPVLTASGTFGFGREYEEYFNPSLLGGIITKGITMEPRSGNLPPRLHETPAGLLNSIGLENPGVEKFINDYLPPIQEKVSTTLIVNISGDTVEQYAEIASKLDGVSGVDALEINISCPNVQKGGMIFGASPETAAAVVAAARKETSLPLIVKLSPNVTDIVEIASAAVDAGADALSLINTLLGMAIDIENESPALGNVFGGLSGPAVKPIALRMLWQVSQKVEVPIIGMGGITKGRDALEFLLAGASAVAVGTSNFVNPFAAVEIISDIELYMKEKEYSSLEQIIGKAWKKGGIKQ